MFRSVLFGMLLAGLVAKADYCSDRFNDMQNQVNYCLSQQQSCSAGGAWGPRSIRYIPVGTVLDGYCIWAPCVSGVNERSVYTGAGIPLSCLPQIESMPQGARAQLPQNACGSIIQTTNGVVGDLIPLVGSTFKLAYFTNWVVGRTVDYSMWVVNRNANNAVAIPSSSIDIRDPQGQSVTTGTLPNSNGQSMSSGWNGLDSSGQETWGRQKFVTVVTTPQLPGTGGGGTRDFINYLGSLKAKKLGIGAWVPSIWKFYDATSATLFSGDGSQRQALSAALAGGGYRVIEQDGSVVYEFDSIGRIVQTRTGILGTTLVTFTYEAHGYLSSIIEPFGRTTVFNRDSSGVLQSITTASGQTITVGFDTNGYLSLVQNPNSEQYQMTYGTGGLLATFQKPNGAVSTFQYSASGELIMDQHSGGSSTQLTSSNFGKQIQVTSQMGRITSTAISATTDSHTTTMPDGSYSYRSIDPNQQTEIFRNVSVQKSFTVDPRFGTLRNRLTALTVQDFGSNSYNFNETATLSNAQNPFSVTAMRWQTTHNAQITATTFSGSNNTFVTTTPKGRIQERVIDSYERPVTLKTGGQTAVQLTYTNENLTQIQQGARTTSFTYHPNSHLLASITNPLMQATSFSYDSSEKLQTVTLPDARVVTYKYDFQGNLKEITPPARPLHSFTFDSKEMLGSYMAPELVVGQTWNTNYEYNNDRQLTKITRPEGQEIQFGYHATTGQHLTTSYLTSSYQRTYDSTKKLASIIAPDMTSVSFNYTGNTPSTMNWKNSSQVIQGTYTVNPVAGEKIGYESIGGASGAINVNYTYDTDLVMTGVKNLTLTVDIPDGKLTGTTLGNLTDTYSYNSFGEVTGYVANYSASPIYSYSLTRDDLGRVSQKTEILNGVTTVWDYVYDVVGRLQDVYKNTVLQSHYTYDGNSNRNGGYIGAATTTATYDGQDRISTFNLNTYTHNRNGEMLTKTDTLLSATTTYSWNAYGTLTGVQMATKTVTYQLDAQQRRFAKLVNGVLQKRYIYDFNNRLVGETNSAGVLQRRYIYASKSHVPDYMIDSALVDYRIITDQIGSVRMVVRKTDGVVMQMMEHDEFGRVLQDTNPGYTPFGFAGGVYDSDTGLVLFQARSYDAETGRWVSKDPILFAGGIGLYGYVSNDPVNWTDPSGLDPGDSFPSAGEAAGDAINYINPTSIRRNLEYGGHIIQNSDGTYSATLPLQGGPAGVNIGLPPANGVASYHTHGAYDSRYDNENFSPTDVLYNAFNGMPGYLGTPAGSIQMNYGSKFRKGLKCPQ